MAAIASRNPSLAQQVAESHQIPTICPTYDDLIQLDTIDAIYIPLPNHLHVEWACKAIKAGKHVLCEKPLGLNGMDVQHLLSVISTVPQTACCGGIYVSPSPAMDTYARMGSNQLYR